MSAARTSASFEEPREAGAPAAAAAAAAMATVSDGKLPLPDDFFTVPQLNPKEAKYLMGLAKHACKEVVYYSRRAGGPMQWVHLASEDGVEVFQGIDVAAGATATSGGVGASSALTYLRGSCRIHASLDEIADFFKLDTPEKLAGFAQTVGKDLLDQKTLMTLATPTPENPKHYVAVKWTAAESPSKLARNRDFCYLESHDEFIDTQSRKRGWVRSIHSIRLPFCPPLRKSHGLVRGSFYRSGFIFIESNANGAAGGTYVDAIHTLHLDIKGHAPMWLKLLTMKRRIKNIAQVNAYFQMRRLARGPRLLGEFELPAKTGVVRCQLCETKFGIFNRKWRCRKCGRVVCTSCGHHFLIDSAVMTGSNAFITASGSGSGNGMSNATTSNAGAGGNGAGQLKKVRICVQCSESVVFGDGLISTTATAATADSNNLERDDDGENARPRGAPVGKRVQDPIRPMYDESPASSASTENPLDANHQQHHGNHYKSSITSNPHQFSIEENEYYAENEDSAGIADMVEAKRMAHEFEEAVLKSSRGPRQPSRSVLSNASGSSNDHTPQPPAAQYQHEYEEKQERNQRPQILKSDHHAERGATGADMGTTPASDATTTVSVGLRNPFSQSFELGRKDSMDSIRMSSDWGNGADGNHSRQHPPHHRGNPTDERRGRRARAERPSGRTDSLVSSVESQSASKSMAAAAAAAAATNRESEASSMDSAFRPSDSGGRAMHRSHDRGHDRQRSFLSEDGWGYRSHRIDSGTSDDDRGFYDAPPRDRLISSHDPASLRRFMAEAQRSGSDRSEEVDRDNASLSNRSMDGESGDRRMRDGTLRRRTKEYFNARNARLAQLENIVGDSVRHYTESASTAASHHRESGDFLADGEDREYERHRRKQRRNRSADSNSFIGRQMYDDDDGGSSAVYRSNRRGRHDSDNSRSSAAGSQDDELAHYMAMEAMRMYEQEMGPRLRVSEDTRRAALRKMMAVYAQEIERSARLEQRGSRPPDRYEGNRERYDSGHSRYTDNAPREPRRRRGSSVDDIGDDSRSYYQHLMGGANAPAQAPGQHALQRNGSDQRYLTTAHHHQAPPAYDDDRYCRVDFSYNDASSAAGEGGVVTTAGPLPAMGLGRASVDSSSSDEDEEENRRRRRLGTNSAGAESAAAHEYRDLADISSRTFQKLQIQSFGPGNGLTERRNDDTDGRADEAKPGVVAAEHQAPPNHRHRSHLPLDESEGNDDAVAAAEGRRNNNTAISAAESKHQDCINGEDDSGSISNSYHHNDSFIGQPSPRFMRDSISTVTTANGRDRRHSNRLLRANTASSLGGNRPATEATSTKAMRAATTAEEGSGGNGDVDSIRSSSIGGMALDADRTTYGSLAASDLQRRSSSSGYYSRHNSMLEVAESDTFSEMDLSELPHLMRKEDEADVILRRSMAMMDRRSVGSRSSFTDLQQWDPSSSSTSIGTGAMSTPNGVGRAATNGIDAEQGERLSDLSAERDEDAEALGMRSLGGPQHVRQFSDDSSTESFMRGWGSEAVAAALVPDSPSPQSSSSSIHHRGHRQNRSFGPIPVSISSEPRLSGASGDFQVTADRLRGTTAFSDTSSSFYSDDGDYRASGGAYQQHFHGQPLHLVPNPRSPSLSSDRQHPQQQQQQQHLSVSELRRYRQSISELLSEYSDGDSGFHQPEGEPDREEGEPVVPTVLTGSSSSRLAQRGPAAFPSAGAAGSPPAMSRGSEKIRELFL